ncbi:hypothetical protein ACFPZL_11865 [Leucobacter soli]|uniref:Uncharacterized protein n=1 Tax=Leucobacter soli TaxID=2812850 RepID=A0A916NIK5_9MICO|nr:hypothetical protein [Leucobacter soli]CAG7617327.1 hypothetical protein LEUCIP111803_02088 [Leucobacter soli]
MGNTKKLGAASLAAIATMALTLGSVGPALAADEADLGTPKISGLATVKVPKSSGKSTFAVRFSGGSSTAYSYRATTETEHLHSIQKINVIRTFAEPPAKLKANAKNTFTIKTNQRNSPGKYRLTVTVFQSVTGASGKTASTSKVYTVRANTSVSRKNTSIGGSGKAKKAYTAYVSAPAYQAGGKVTLYFKATGAKKWKKVGTGKLKHDRYWGTSSNAKVKIGKKHNVAGKGGKLYAKIGSVKYASSYKSKSVKVKKVG